MQMHSVKVIDNNTGDTLYSCSFKEVESAYKKASEFEDYGLDVKVEVPTITESLAQSLGISDEALEKYNESVIAEIHDHDGCSACSDEDQ